MILSRIETKLDTLLHAVYHVLLKEHEIMAILDQLTVDVQENMDAVASAVVLLQGLKAKLDEAGVDPVKLAELSAALDSNTKALADAVVANTPTP
jgi:hypothetical protein